MIPESCSKEESKKILVIILELFYCILKTDTNH